MGGNYKLQARDNELLQGLVQRSGGTIYTEAPVAGPIPPWASSTPLTTVDAVWFPNARSDGVVRSAEQPDAFRAMAQSHEPTLVSARGYLDRTAFGVLLAGRVLYARTFAAPPPRCVALAEAHFPNAERVYNEHSIDVMTLSDDVNHEVVRASRGGAVEDPLLLMHYARHYRARGTLLTEGRIPPWRVDGLWCDEGHMTVRECNDINTITPGARVELIEVKPSLNTDVIGQAVAGATRLRHLAPHLLEVPTHVVVGPAPHIALDWVCEQLNVAVFRY